MENNEQESLLQMHLDYDGGNILRETVRWSRFLSIVGIVGLSIGVLAMALAGTALLTLFSRFSPNLEALAGMGGAIIFITVLLFFAAFGYLAYVLFRFSTLTRRGIDHQDPNSFTEGMRHLKIYFLISGAFAILGLLFNLYSLIKTFL